MITSKRKGKALMYSVPYSEHSSYDEMKAFVAWLQPTELIPSVKVQDRRALEALLLLAGKRTGAGATPSLRLDITNRLS